MHVLVVDSDPRSARETVALCVRLGHDTRFAASAREAVARFTS